MQTCAPGRTLLQRIGRVSEQGSISSMIFIFSPQRLLWLLCVRPSQVLQDKIILRLEKAPMQANL